MFNLIFTILVIVAIVIFLLFGLYFFIVSSEHYKINKHTINKIKRKYGQDNN